MNRSPWIEELDANRVWDSLPHDTTTDVAIVGAGIAGMSTAFFTLTRTNKRIIMLERSLLAHGASGHNAGTLVAAFERPLHQLAKESPPALVAQAQRDIEGAWAFLDEILAALDIDMPYHRKTGFAGLRTLEEVSGALEDTKWRKENGLSWTPVLVAEEAPYAQTLASVYEGLYELRSHDQVLDLLETKHREYMAAKPEEFGIMNSALLCEELLAHFKEVYPSRFVLYERTPVSKVVLHEENALLDAGQHTVDADQVILCTNGFEDMDIINKSGLDIDTKFHHLISGKIGFMTGYLEHSEKLPRAGHYTSAPGSLALNQKEAGFKDVDAFLYTSRRPHRSGNMLITLGGPEMQLMDRATYNPEMELPETVLQRIEEAVRSLHNIVLSTKEGRYIWHGLMGYTPTGVRVVGAEPKNPVLLYNLGCNGIGLLPAIAGSKRISSILAGEKPPLSLFDPQ